MKDKALLSIAIKAAVEAGNLLNKHKNDFLLIDKKESQRDIVTEIDKLAENKIKDILHSKAKGIPVLGEESGRENTKNPDALLWIVDPIDGTVNFVNHIPLYCISIALVKKNKPILGVIYNPVLNDLYYALKGFGAYKNNRKISIGQCKGEEGLYAVSFSGKKLDPRNRKKEFISFGKVNDASRGCLRTGSAAQNLSFVAEGKLSGCFGKANKIWDVSAGLLIAEIAGAKVIAKKHKDSSFLIDYCIAAPKAFDFLLDKCGIFK